MMELLWAPEAARDREDIYDYIETSLCRIWQLAVGMAMFSRPVRYAYTH